MLIYRIENDLKSGAYSFKQALDCERLNHQSTDVRTYRKNHPAPLYDNQLSYWWFKKEYKNEISDLIFGFNSIEQLLDWFPISGLEKFDQLVKEEIARKRKEETCISHSEFYTFGISVYSINKRKVKQGERQVIFQRDSGRLVKRYTFEEFIKMVSEKYETGVSA